MKRPIFRIALLRQSKKLRDTGNYRPQEGQWMPFKGYTKRRSRCWACVPKKNAFILLHKRNGWPFYVSILQTQLLSAAQHIYGKNWRLQQDNDPKQLHVLQRILL